MFFPFEIKINNIFWEKVKANQWEKLHYPWRPNQQELFLVENWIIQKKVSTKNIKVAILGSTPEYRSFCSKYKLNVDVVDLSANMYRQMSTLSLPNKKEKFYQDDWTNHLAFHPDYYDIIIGDLIDRLMDKKMNLKMYDCIKNSLKKEGVFIRRSHVFINKNKSSIFKLKIKEDPEIFADKLFFILSPKCLKGNYIDINKMKRIVIKSISSTDDKKLKKCLNIFLEKWTTNFTDYYLWPENFYSKISNYNFILINGFKNYLDNNQYIETSLWQKNFQK